MPGIFWSEHTASNGSPSSIASASWASFAVATLKSVFENLDFYPADGNVVAVAYDGPKLPDADLMRQAKQAQARHGFRYSLPEMAPERRYFSPGAKIKPLTDDFAPVNSLKSIKKHNLKWD